MTLHHALVLRSDNKEIAVLLTPTALTNKERAAILENPMFPGMALFRKSAPAYPGRYPYVVVEVRLSGPASADNVKSYYIKAYGVRKVNHTDNINGMPDTNSRFKVIEVQGEHMRMQFSGQTKILGKLRSWTFDIEL
ncbi:MAG: hypothetical protein L0I62_05445 [Gammaproteobacteria bacterium]|nr:hypothetical protein [Gammaproteobacteria bacterium]